MGGVLNLAREREQKWEMCTRCVSVSVWNMGRWVWIGVGVVVRSGGGWVYEMRVV